MKAMSEQCITPQQVKWGQGAAHSSVPTQPLETMEETGMLLTFSQGKRMTKKQTLAVRSLYFLNLKTQADIQWSIFPTLISNRLMEEKKTEMKTGAHARAH